jgi:HAE1 family hydrophobic/amphiphilic exporter-1
MRDQNFFAAALPIGVVVAGLFVFGADPVRAQTATGTQATSTSQSGQVTAGVRRLSMDEAVALALEQNVNLQVDRIDPQIQDLTVAEARSAWTPAVSSALQWRDATQQPQDFLSGNINQISNGSQAYNFGVGSLLPWGGSYNASWNNGRATTDNIAASFSPQLSSSIVLNYTQPLLRNFRIDSTRQQVLVSQKNREISDVQVRESMAGTVRSVKSAYYDLMFAISNLGVQRQSLELAQRSLKDNRARVEIGTMAPIDIVEAEAEVARREESVILAEAQIERAQDRLRTLIFDPSRTDLWNVRLEPTETVQFQPMAVDPDAAVRAALDQRTDLNRSRKQIEANDVNIRFFRDQTLPDVNAQVNYFASGLGGTGFIRGPGFPPPVISTVERSYSSVLGLVFGADYPTTTFGLQVSYPIGRSSAEASLARARLQNTQAQKQLQAQEMQVAAQVREAARQVQTNSKRVDATRAARALGEKRLEAEEKKFQAGMTSSFLVFQAQRDLNQARNNELQAMLDYARSVVDFETAQEAPIGATGGVTGISGVGFSSDGFSSGGFSGGTGTTGQRQQQ